MQLVAKRPNLSTGTAAKGCSRRAKSRCPDHLPMQFARKRRTSRYIAPGLRGDRRRRSGAVSLPAFDCPSTASRATGGWRTSTITFRTRTRCGSCAFRVSAAFWTPLEILQIKSLAAFDHSSSSFEVVPKLLVEFEQTLGVAAVDSVSLVFSNVETVDHFDGLTSVERPTLRIERR